jgi:16S rRNA (cytosine967-C5)-methyltransferase
LDWLWRSRLTEGRAGLNLVLVLRLGLAQLLYFDRLGEHAAVSETVALAKELVPGRHGLVNALLRGLLRERDGGGPWPPVPPPGPDEASTLALRHSYPVWMAAGFLDLLGPAEAEALLLAGNRPTPPTLRINPRRKTREELLPPFKVRPTELAPWGLRAEEFAGRPETWPGFEEGLFAIQDEASQLVGLLAGELPIGAGILDVCAGLGGKALHLAALYPTATVTARDRDKAKLIRLGLEARRLGLANLRLEAREALDETEDRLFDLVLVDAPCSGLGVIRRRPDLKWSKQPADVPRLAGLQLDLLKAASGRVGSGGRLIYGVCSLSRAEGPETAAKFLAARPDFRAVPPTAWPEVLRPHLHLEEGHLTLWPHRHQTDGFFWALFERTS